MIPEAFPFHAEPGWRGHFTRDSAPSALPAGSRIAKTQSEEGDTMPNGSTGTILGSYAHPDVQDGVILYFVEWDGLPRVAVSVIGWKLRTLDGGHHGTPLE